MLPCDPSVTLVMFSEFDVRRVSDAELKEMEKRNVCSVRKCVVITLMLYPF